MSDTAPEPVKPLEKVPRLSCPKCATRFGYEDPPGSGDYRCAGCGRWDFKSAREMTFKRTPKRRRRR